jgi:hypothetical protein
MAGHADDAFSREDHGNSAQLIPFEMASPAGAFVIRTNHIMDG